MTEPQDVMAEPLTAEELEAWLRRTVGEAYHDPNPHHSFEECGDPFCVEAKARMEQLAALVRTPETLDATDVYATAMLGAWRKTKDFLRDRLLTSGRSDVNINAVLRVMNEALHDLAASPAPDPGAGLAELQQLSQAATPGMLAPDTWGIWTANPEGMYGLGTRLYDADQAKDEDAAFIVAAVNYVRSLLAPSAEPPETT